jgi:hypothetical protein
MIKLKINPDSKSTELIFNKKEITIGSGITQSVDLSLPEELLHDIHVLISFQDNKFLITNVANDPLVTLNGSPFWKKTINTLDRIQIGKTTIEFCVDFEDKKPIIDELEALLRQVDELDSIDHTEVKVQDEEVYIAPKKPSIIIETSSSPEQEPELQKIPDLEDITPASMQENLNENKAPINNSNFRFYLTIVAAVCVAMFLSSVIFYVRVNSQSHREKIIAAEGVSDVSMALTYAQVYRLKPQRQNWIDPEFLKTNLSSVLSPGYPTFANIDKQGQFLNCPYILRIYTSSDLSRFLVIAQPEPSLMQWLVPKATIALDSTTMELHSIDDIKILNRLLANANSLDDFNAKEISELVQSSPIITLDLFGSKKGFLPPRALSLVFPGAENVVYNSPRYYHFGESLLKRAVDLVEDFSNKEEIVRLQQEVSELSKFPNMVIYSSQGIEKALQAHQALTMLAPDNSFLAAYLSFNHHGVVIGSHLLYEGNSTSELIDQADLEPIPFGDDFYERQLLLTQLKTLAYDRHEALKAISDDMIALLHNNTTGHAIAFSDRFPVLWDKYQKTDIEYNNNISSTLESIYAVHSDMKPELFGNYLRAAGLGNFADKTLVAEAIKNDEEKKIKDLNTRLQLSH